MTELEINQQGWLENCQKIPSPNYDERSDENDICLIVVHCISLPPKQFSGGYIEQFFCNQLDSDEHDYFKTIADMTVSAHILIRRDGSLVQFVPFLKRAWHAGVSKWNNREKCNDFSIGIELEGADDIAYTDEQYQQLNTLVKVLRKQYPKIAEDAVVGHCDIAPGRKTDPGEAFDWNRLNSNNRF